MSQRYKQLLQRSSSRDMLPVRISDEIHRQDAAAERLIGWVQFGVVVFFALLYGIAPRAEGTAGFSPWSIAPAVTETAEFMMYV